MYLISKTDLEAQIGKTISVDMANSIISKTEGLIHSFCNVDTFEGKELVEDYTYSNDNVYILNYNFNKSLLEVNGVAFSGKYRIIDGKILEFGLSETLEADEDFNTVSFKFRKGFNDTDVNYDNIPQDLKNVALIIGNIIYNKETQLNKDASGIKRYTIGDLTEEYDVDNKNMKNISESNGIYGKDDIYKLLEKYQNANLGIVSC